ncbi:succinate dehydrogenase, hydrophobic membrane anchor protein [Candidatus Tisiphia endosymbiont of Oplodontha viridula]|uniref:succinate dehydrogenase, hydrophobic membrane anchor protein n=1 Tax=Candidatus Tisiphia endosymbiont of Oplodontha viridula TaxID=3077925 RepID=UPI0035C8DFDB
MNNNLRTDLAKAKGVGSAKSGSSHWLHQRITAIILVVCSIWLIFFIKYNMGKDLIHVVGTLQKPYNIAPLGILIITSLYHAMLGMRIIIEDYISCIKLRIGLIIFLQIFCIITIVFLVVALFYAITV